MKNNFRFSRNSLIHRQGIRPELIEINDYALSISPIDFGIPVTGGVRDTILQNKLFLDDKSKCDGYSKVSHHQILDETHPELPELGHALDFYAYINGRASWQPHHLAIIAAAHLQAACHLGYVIEWGGLWPWDMPHIQMPYKKSYG